jgi:ketosteroid isomerase-like protein
MTSEEIVREFYSRFAVGEIDRAIDLLSADVVWELYGPSDIPYFGAYQGKRGVRDFFEKLAATEEIREFTPEIFHATTDTVCVEGSEVCAPKATGKTFSARWVQVFGVKDGRINSWKEYIDTHAMALAHRG